MKRRMVRKVTKLTGLLPPKDGSPGEKGMPVSLRLRLSVQASADVDGLAEAHKKYGDSWRKRGGGEAYHNLTRKWDRLERAVEALPSHDIFEAVRINVAGDGTITGKDGLLDDIRDFRRYLHLVEEFVTRNVE